MNAFRQRYLNTFLPFFGFVLLSMALAIGLAVFSKNYQKIYETPILQEGVLDLTGYDPDNRAVDYSLAGSWNFYYNRWIVTDAANGEEIQTEPQQMVLPGRWNDAFSLPRDGYASYSIQLTGFVEGETFRLVLNNFRASWRAYINGELVTASGEMSKTQTYAAGRTTYSAPFTVTDEETVELVLEIGYTDEGGFYSVPWLVAYTFSQKNFGA